VHEKKSNEITLKKKGENEERGSFTPRRDLKLDARRKSEKARATLPR
jgi:hypothetical protein